jgi:pimeloyl-ACP methyl ester carboxylesterase
MVPRARLLLRRGYSVLLIDLQAHGETPGEAITFGWRESEDVQAAIAWIRHHEPGRRVGAIGTSLGGAALAFAHPTVDAVVLEEVYPRLAQAVEDRVRIRLGWLAPVVAPVLLVQLQPRIGVGAAALEPIRFVSQLRSPILVAGGEADPRTPGEETRALFGAAKPPRELWIEPRAAHQDLLAFDARAYEAHVVGFLDRYLLPPGVSRP